MCVEVRFHYVKILDDLDDLNDHSVKRIWLALWLFVERMSRGFPSSIEYIKHRAIVQDYSNFYLALVSET